MFESFEMRARGTSPATEAMAGVTTFFALSYILFVQPAVMAAAGIPAGTALVATCVGSAIACVAMGWLANLPIALAPGMGHNFYFAFTVCAPVAAGGFGLTPGQALSAVVIAGALFILLATVRFRERLLEAIPPSLQHAIAAGIGLLIAFIGLEWGGLVVDHPSTLVALGDFTSPVAGLTLFGLAWVAILLARGVRAALLISIASTLALAIGLHRVELPRQFLQFDLDYRPVLGDLDPSGLLRAPNGIETILVMLFLAVFDTIGTLVGVSSRAGLMRDGKLPNAGRALLADAIGTVSGGLLGTSTITSYVESAAGVQAGGRTGFASLVTAACLLFALPLAPWIALVGEGVTVGGTVYHPVLAPALIAVGAMMAKSALSIRFDDPIEGLPCFVAMIVIPLSFSITDGIAAGFVLLSVSAIGAGQPGRLRPLGHGIALACLGWYVLRHAN